MINFTKELAQNTTVIQSEHTEQYSKRSNDSANQRQSMISTVDNNNGQKWTTIRGATCIDQRCMQHQCRFYLCIILSSHRSIANQDTLQGRSLKNTLNTKQELQKTDTKYKLLFTSLSRTFYISTQSLKAGGKFFVEHF